MIQKSDTQYERSMWCEYCNGITQHLIALDSATDKGVIFFKSCNNCRNKMEDEENPWEIERIPVKDWNTLITVKLY